MTARKIQKPISFDKDAALWLDDEATREVTSVSEIVRRAVRAYRERKQLEAERQRYEQALFSIIDLGRKGSIENNIARRALAEKAK